jgi:hypothetical protein
MLLGLGFVTNANANSCSPVVNENTISAQFDFDGGIVDPDNDDEVRPDSKKG